MDPMGPLDPLLSAKRILAAVSNEWSTWTHFKCEKDCAVIFKN